MKKLTVVGLGPGAGKDLTGRARDALKEAELIVGYTAYIDLIRDFFPSKEFASTGMTKEIDRCRMAVETAAGGKTVAVVCSGDAGIYGMAGLIYEVAQDFPPIDIEVIPGVTAACGGGGGRGGARAPPRGGNEERGRAKPHPPRRNSKRGSGDKDLNLA